MIKLNIGCGLNYREDFTNLDSNPLVKADVYADLNEPLPFEDNTFDYIYIHYCLEHVKDFFKTIDEIYRISMPGAIIEIYVPHYTSIYNFKYPYHYQNFGIGTFLVYTDESDNKQRHGIARFKVQEERIHLISKNIGIWKYLNSLFNYSRPWQQICERFWVFGFDEVFYKLEVLK